MSSGDSDNDSDNEPEQIQIDIPLSTLYGKHKDKYTKGERSRKLMLFYKVVTAGAVAVEYKKESEDVAAIARKLERGCYNTAKAICADINVKASWKNKEFLCTYDTICFELYKALDSSPGNTAYVSKLVKSILNDSVDPESLGAHDAITLNPARAIEAIDIVERSKGTAIVTFKGSSYHQCLCGSSYTRTVSIQDRSLDEGASKKVICLVCGNHWSEK